MQEDIFREIMEFEETLWWRRMRLLHHYQKVEEMRNKVTSLEKRLEQELHMDMETAYELLSLYEQDPNKIEFVREAYGEEIFISLKYFMESIRDLKEMRDKVDEMERDLKEVDMEMDEVFYRIQDYKKWFQEPQ